MHVSKNKKKEARRICNGLYRELYNRYLKRKTSKEYTYEITDKLYDELLMEGLKKIKPCDSIEEIFSVMMLINNSLTNHINKSICYSYEHGLTESDGFTKTYHALRENYDKTRPFKKEILELASSNINEKGFKKTARAVKQDFEIFNETRSFSPEDVKNGVKSIYYLENASKNRSGFSKFIGFFTGRNSYEKRTIEDLKQKIYSTGVDRTALDNAMKNPFDKEIDKALETAAVNELNKDLFIDPIQKQIDLNNNKGVDEKSLLDISDSDLDRETHLDTSSVFYDIQKQAGLKDEINHENHFALDLEAEFGEKLTNVYNQTDYENLAKDNFENAEKKYTNDDFEVEVL